MERLLAMRRELKAEYAKEAFDHALSAFQSECPVIEKTKKVLNKDKTTTRYVYAPLETIIEQIKPLLRTHGFSYMVDANVEDKWVTAILKLTHELGHSETSSFKDPLDPESYMNAPQRFASALTFAKRYAFCNALGILTGDEDDDSNQVPPQKSSVATQGRQGTTKPAQPAIAPPKPQKSDKERIAMHLEELGIDWKDAEQAKGAILSLTQLTPEEANFPEIESRLSIR